jgi:hypothetical protein
VRIPKGIKAFLRHPSKLAALRLVVKACDRIRMIALNEISKLTRRQQSEPAFAEQVLARAKREHDRKAMKQDPLPRRWDK